MAFRRAFADEPLLERLRLLARDDMSDVAVRTKCDQLFRQWAASYKSTPGMNRLATLYKDLPQTKQGASRQSLASSSPKEEPGQRDVYSPDAPSGRSRRRSSAPFSVASSSGAYDGKLDLSSQAEDGRPEKSSKKSKPFSLDKEKPKMLETIASATVASTNLVNALKLINRETQRVSGDRVVMKRFETCKVLRRQVLHYIQLVDSEQYIGSLLSANDELVKALQAFEILDKSVDDDSDSEAEANPPPSVYLRRSGVTSSGKEPLNDPRHHGESLQRLGTSSNPPAHSDAAGSRRTDEYGSDAEYHGDDADDEENPFGDQNALETPSGELSQIRWYSLYLTMVSTHKLTLK